MNSAGEVVADLAGRLADPALVATADPWSTLSLGEGHPSVALLFAELSHVSPEHRRSAHAHITVAAQDLASASGDGLFSGAASLAFAARAAQHRTADYATLLDRLDDHIVPVLRRRISSPQAGTWGYDVISGATGLGRYLLLRHHSEVVADVLGYLVRLTEPISVHGHDVPGWWVAGSPLFGDDTRFPRGHFNLGLAHGISGPLALLALSWAVDVRVPGQDEAIGRIVEWLSAWQISESLWPAAVGFDEHVSGAAVRPARTAWCYGTPGVAHAIYLAGRAMGRTDWQQTAITALDGALASPEQVSDCGFCHGWAGLLQVTWRMARESGDERLAAHLPSLAGQIVRMYDESAPFGFPSAGFLDGAVGIALALHTYATDTEPASQWDAAALLS
jgi:hypothetical protein